MKTMKKFIALILCMVTLLSAITPVLAAEEGLVCYSYTDCTENGGEIYEVKKDNCAVRAKAKNTGKVIARLPADALVSIKETKITARLTRWGRIDYVDDSGKEKHGWIHLGNLTLHKHRYTTVAELDNDNLRVCIGCAHALLETDGEIISGNILSVFEQGIYGDFSPESLTIGGFIARCVVGEVTPVGDLRDLLSDLWYQEAPWVITADVVALILPLVSTAKYVAKNIDMLPDLLKNSLRLVKIMPEFVDGCYAIGKYKLPQAVYDVFLMGNRGLNAAQSGIHGAHNMACFLESLSNVNGSILQRAAHGKIPGIYNIAYTFQKADGAIGTARIAKTVYDPDVISDIEILQYMVEAFSNPTKISEGKFIGKASNGLWFEGNINELTGEISHVFIALEDLGARHGL